MSDEGWSADEAYRRHARAVLGYLRAACRNDAEDLFGDVFVNVARSIGRFRGDEDALRHWLFTIARNRVLDHQRREARRRSHPAPLGPVGAPAPPEEPLDPQLVTALQGLTDDQREVVALRFIGDLSLDAVAHLTGRTTGAVKALQHRGLEALAAELDRWR